MKNLQVLILIGFSILALPSELSAQFCEGAHSSSLDDSWLSCVETQNPNPDRSEGHWILYDFGDYYELNQSHFWNYNVMDETDRGVATMIVDWSIDGTTWSWWGDINLEQAPGSNSYIGEAGPDFDGLVVRYLLLSVASNHGGNCYGFSELRLDVNPGVVNIDEISVASFNFGLHPNPATNHATIQIESFSDTRVNLFSPVGTLVATYHPNSETTRLDLRNLASGAYLVEVINGSGEISTQRLNVIR
ncbi:MAG TPA: T9SS type A sorting domain-containing protein [Flavobacteriales bacterium]|jgi:hypothetical protein|nr:T9SS type A sorting domain-containing protein [Flavobacteriales bacterium]HIO58787.1 T9SS type A sorting domain-containing protein [Flavobacteriales bacterium]